MYKPYRQILHPSIVQKFNTSVSFRGKLELIARKSNVAPESERSKWRSIERVVLPNLIEEEP
jgi:hypothetical protein